jgi:hypothetical protein
MKQRILFILLLLLSGNMLINAQVSLTATSGTTSGTYSTLGAAFAKINDGTHKGVITISLNGSTTEGSTALLSASGSGSANYTSVSISPTTTNVSVSGNMGSPLIDLNGADNVTIDGRVNASGSTINLVIRNNSTGGGSTSAIRFINGATNNTVKYCTIQGSNSDTGGGILNFNTSTGSSGNSSNTIDHNEITCASANRPMNAIYSNGNNSYPNISNTISNNNIYNFLSPTGRSTAICLANQSEGNNLGYNSSWSITGNSFYETTSFSPTAGNPYNIIFINTRDNSTSYGDNFTISNNYFGGSAPGCVGTFTKLSGSSNYFTAMQLHVGTTNPTNVQGNTIKNFNYCNNSRAYWIGIYIDWGAVNVGTTSPNYIGSASDTGSIFFSCQGTDSDCKFWGIHLQGDGPCYVQNNVIGSITVANYNHPASATNFIGIHQQSRYSDFTITNNTIGSATTANSIKAISASTTDAQSVIGYSGDGNGGNITISNNTIANLTNFTTNTSSTMQGKIYGIFAFSDQYTISGNIIHDLTIANANTSTGPVPGQPDNTSLDAGGILVSVNSGSYHHAITGNTIYNISNTYPSFSGTIAGVYFYGTSLANTIDKNFVYGLNVSSSNSASIYGIMISQGVTTTSNNIVTLSGNTTTNLYGIYESGGSNSYANSLYYNTVYLGGSPTSGSLNSYCLYSALNSNTRNFRNNIFDNARSNSGASGKHYAMYFVNTGGNLTCDYNDYYVSGTGGVLGHYGSDKTSVPIVTGVTGNDVNSHSTLPGFANPGGTTASSYIPTTILPAVTGTGITTDYTGATRSASAPGMGAYELGAAINWTGNTSTDWNTGSNWSSGAVPTPGLNISIGIATNQPHVTQPVTSPALCNNLTILSGAVVTINAGKALTVNGTLTNNAGTSGLVIKSDATGTGSLLQTSASVGATVQRYITGNANLSANVYHFVSIPVYYSNPTSNLFLGSYLYQLDATQLNSQNYYGNWVNLGTSTTTPLSCNTGYMIYYGAASHTYSFSGNLNTGPFSSAVLYGGTFTFNLVPNPYPSAISWGASSGWTKTNIGGPCYIWSATGGNYHTLPEAVDSYIPQGQSFIVMADGGSPVLSMNNSVCVHNGQTFYKSGSTLNHLTVSASSNNYYDETVIAFDPEATPDFDPQLDGIKLNGLDDAPQLYTQAGSFKLSLNTLPLLTGSLSVPMDFETQYTGDVTLQFSGIDSFDPDLPVRLQDLITGALIDLRQQQTYTFSHVPSNTNARFKLLFGWANGIADHSSNDGKLWLWGKSLYIDGSHISGSTGELEIFNLLGQRLYSQTLLINGLTTVTPGLHGMIIARLTCSGEEITTRGFIEE